MTPGGPGLWKAIHKEAWACRAGRERYPDRKACMDTPLLRHTNLKHRAIQEQLAQAGRHVCQLY